MAKISAHSRKGIPLMKIAFIAVLIAASGFFLTTYVTELSLGTSQILDVSTPTGSFLAADCPPELLNDTCAPSYTPTGRFVGYYCSPQNVGGECASAMQEADGPVVGLGFNDFVSLVLLISFVCLMAYSYMKRDILAGYVHRRR